MRTATILALSITLMTGQASRPAKREHKAHAHGAAKLDLALDGQRVQVEFESPAHAVVGFEYTPKSAADKKRVETALTTLKSRIGEMVIFPAASACVFTPSKVELHPDGDHSEVHATFTVACGKPLDGGIIRFGVTKVFPEIEEVAVQWISDKQQTSVQVKRDRGTLTIAK